MEPLNFDGKCILECNHSHLHGKCLKQRIVENASTKHNYNLLVEKKNFNDPSLPEHIDENTVFGLKTKSEFGISDVIFPNKLPEVKSVESENLTELYKISHHVYGIGEQLNRKYTAHFDPSYRYGKHLKYLPPGAWFKNKVEQVSSNKDKKKDFTRKLLESEQHEHCNRYPYVDNRQGKFPGRSYFRVEDILSGKEPDENKSGIVDYLLAINKIKLLMKKKKYNVKELRDEYKYLDEELTGLLPLDLVYNVCYQRGIKLEKKLFDLALNSIHAINNHDVRYDLFVDLIDPNVQFSVNFAKDDKSEGNRCMTNYKSDYENKFHRSVQLNKSIDHDASSYVPVKPLVLAHFECFGSETDVKMLLNPTIFSNYGLTYRDFYMRRNKDVMAKLFKDFGVHLSDDNFNIIWKNACQCDGFDDQVSVETFIRAFREFAHMNNHQDQID